MTKAAILLLLLLLPIATEGMFWNIGYPEDFIDALTSPKDRWFKADGWSNVSLVHNMCTSNHNHIECRDISNSNNLSTA